MPYIKTEVRDVIDPKINDLLDTLEDLAGEGQWPGATNYTLTRIILESLPHPDNVSYGEIALVTGILENVKQEFYRRYAAPYEDRKIEENGDVYGIEAVQ